MAKQEAICGCDPTQSTRRKFTTTQKILHAILDDYDNTFRKKIIIAYLIDDIERRYKQDVAPIGKVVVHEKTKAGGHL